MLNNGFGLTSKLEEINNIENVSSGGCGYVTLNFKKTY